MAANKRDGLTRVQRAAWVLTLKEKGGLSAKEIAAKLGLSPNYVRGLLADPSGETDRKRKDRYRGTCMDCGGPTTYSKKTGTPILRCRTCDSKYRAENRKWTPERIVADIRRWNEIYGEPPRAMEWIRYTSPDGDREWPHVMQIQRVFGTWSNAIEAAGFERRVNYERTDEWKAKVTKWPKEKILQMMRDWAKEHGRAPRPIDWRSRDYPNEFTVRKKFGSWSKAVRAAGLEPAPRLRPKRKSREISTITELAKAMTNGDSAYKLPSFEERGEGKSLIEVVRDLGKEKT